MRIPNLANVKKIAIGFGDGNGPAGDGTVYFDEILLGNGNADEPFYDGAVELEEDEDPFVFGFDDDNDPLYLKQGCRLIEAGAGYIDEYPYLLGKASSIYLVPDTNNLHGIPDTNMVNIGCHYFDWNYAYGVLKSDLYRDKVVNFVDFAFLAAGWLTVYDMDDLVSMADEWMEIAEPNIPLNIAGDANTGFVEVGVDGYSSDTQRIFLLVDGQYAGEIFGFKHDDTLGIDVSKLSGGEHQLKAVGVDRDRVVTCSNITNTEFSCPLNYCMLPESYEPNKPSHFSAFNPSAEDVTVNVYADCGNLVWSQAYSGNSILGSVPADITRQYDFDYISLDGGGGGEMLRTGTGGMAAMDAGGGWSIGTMSTAIDPAGTTSGNIRALIILPDPKLTWYDIKKQWRFKKLLQTEGLSSKG